MTALTIGSRVLMKSNGLTGVVTAIDPRCEGGKPCPCCGRGVAVEDKPGSAYGVAPSDCILVGGGLAFMSSGGMA